MNQSNIKFMPHLKGTGTGRGLYLIYSPKSDITSSAYTHLIDVFSGSLEKMFFDVVAFLPCKRKIAKGKDVASVERGLRGIVKSP